MERKTSRPVKTFKLRGITASVFKNSSKSDGQDVIFYRMTIQRTYKDGEKFKTTTSFSRDDWPTAVHLGNCAWDYITEALRNASDEER